MQVAPVPTISLMIPPELLERVRKLAAARDQSISAIVRQAIRAYLAYAEPGDAA
jgi:predicted transcriptional regulator